jgi:heterodisulfide reductase subunit D
VNTFKEVIEKNQAWLCLDCGKCSSVCPITLHLVEGYTSPRLLVETAVACGENITLEDPLLWSCLTCQRCSEICPSEVNFSAFVQGARQLAFDQGLSGSCTHSGMIQGWMRMMANPDLEQDRLEWLTDDIAVDQDSDTIYFPGCLPYYDTAFADLGFEGLDIARGAVSILNALGIQPQILANERCCGHDLYWQGDLETFQKLAALNLEIIQGSGAKRIITTCPECAYTLRTTYPEEIGELGLEVFHISEFLATQPPLKTSDVNSGPESIKVTYQDPCRLGRFSRIYQQPRDLITQLGFDLVEMDHNQKTSICCGTSCWSTCGQVNKKIQSSRLDEASSTGAELLITACLKCQIHLKCAQKTPGNGDLSHLPIRDLTTLLAERI